MTLRGNLRAGSVLAVLVGLLVAGCSQGGPATPAPTPDVQTAAPTAATGSLDDTRWEASQLGGSPVLEGSTVTAAFGADGSLAGSGGCNRYRTTYTTADTTIAIEGAVASTMMACDQAVMAQEAAFFTVLADARSFAVTAEELTLSDGAGATLVVFDVQPQEVAGTWVVTGYHDGDSAVVSTVQGSTPTVEFAEDGTVSGTGGCNQLAGSFEVDGNAIKIGPLASTMMSCEEPAGVMEQESALVVALESAATYSIEGDHLEFRRADGVMAATLTRG
ncbi:META domain-containing protein [Propioniciclava sp. MC1683]|uniref:META domain-containing protein n=1 Tax=Propioniciclava sp. MC1683 TaxID=2760309 RepID=UPI00160478DA|nr:META domain-containing protein [Propioniciclava sp. MC1683]MBB1503072.1 META domain-containing protein [Propioniciclava sp. MC1683]